MVPFLLRTESLGRPSPLVEKDRSTGTWQMLVPRTETSCNVFGTNDLASLTGWGGGARRQCRGLCLESLATLPMLQPPRPVVLSVRR